MAIESINRYLIRPVINSTLFRMAADSTSALVNNALETIRDEKNKTQRDFGDCCSRLRGRLCPRKESDSDVEDSEDISPRSPRQRPRVRQQDDSDSDGSITPRSLRNRPRSRYEQEMDRLEMEMNRRDRELNRYNTIDCPIRELMNAIRTETHFYFRAQRKHELKEFIHGPLLDDCTDAFIVEMIEFCLNQELHDEAKILLDAFNTSHPGSRAPARRLYSQLLGRREDLDNADELINNFFTSREDFSFLTDEEQIAVFYEAFKNGNTEIVDALFPNMKEFVSEGIFPRKDLEKMIESDTIANSALMLWTCIPEEKPKK